MRLQTIAMDQLYTAFYPPNVKYMTLFANGTKRIVNKDKKSREDFQRKAEKTFKEKRDILLLES